MKQYPQIKIVAYHKGSRKVTHRDQANFVKIQLGSGEERELLTLHKSSFDTYKDRPVISWEKLPMTI